MQKKSQGKVAPDSKMPYCETEKEARAQWSSEPAFVFSMAAAAVGLGNLWRFPYMVGENGGAAFIIAYLISLVLLAMPIMMLEVGAGRMTQGSVVATFAKVKGIGRIYGWAVVILTIIITSYYLVVTGWTMGYAFNAVQGNLRIFEDFTSGYDSVWFFLAVTVLAGLVLLKGVAAIEKLSKILMPVLVLMIVSIVYLASQMDGWGQAKDFLTQADFSRLGDLRLWFFAVGQAFYTLAIGQGYLVTYGSYIPRKTHLPRATLIVAFTETSIALLAGLMIFPFVFTFGMDPGEGSQLAFSTLPLVFEEMTGGLYLGIGFFTLFFLAAFSSCLAGLKVIISALEEQLSISHTKTVILVAVLMVILGMPSALSFSPLELTIAGMPVLDFMDQFGGTNVVIASGIFGAGIFSWFVPRHKVRYSLGSKSRIWEFMIFIIARSLPFAAVALVIYHLIS